MSEMDGQSVEVHVSWPEGAVGNPDLVNQFVLVGGPPVTVNGETTADGLTYVLFGHVTPPLLLDAQAIAAFASAPDVTVDVRASLAFTRDRLLELRDAINRQLDQAV